MRGTGDWVTDQRPKNWREGILFLYPNGKAPLTAMLSMAKSKKTDDPEFYWWEKSLPLQSGAITDTYEDATFGDTAASGESFSEDDVIHVKVALAVAKEFRAGHTVLLRNSADYGDDIAGRVTDVSLNGASSRISIQLLEDEPQAGAIGSVNRIDVIGNSNPEGGIIPDSISYDATKLYNYTQIFRTPLEITRTARQTRLRTGDALAEMRREALELHSIEMEKALIWGRRTEKTGSNGKPERTMMGLLQYISTYGDTTNNVSDYSIESSYSSDTWLTSGHIWLNEMLANIFRYGRQEKVGLCGYKALLGINRLAENLGTINLQPAAGKYGLRVMEWITPFGVLVLKTHPLFSYNPTDQSQIVIFEPEELTERYILQTKKCSDPDQDTGGFQSVDAIKEEFKTETSLELHHSVTCGLLRGVGTDNSL